EPNGTYRLFPAAARRPGDAGDRDAGARAGIAHGTGRHGAYHRFTHRPVRGDGCGIDAKQLDLGFIGVGHEPALEPVAGPRQFGAGGRDQPAGAAFGGRQHPAFVLQQRRQLFRRLHSHQNLHAAMTSKVQNAATRSSKMMPKPPRQPNPWNRSSAHATGPGLAASNTRNSTNAANWPAQLAGMTSQSTIQKAITSSQTMLPGSSTRMCAAVTVQAHQPIASAAAITSPMATEPSHFCITT